MRWTRNPQLKTRYFWKFARLYQQICNRWARRLQAH